MSQSSGASGGTAGAAGGGGTGAGAAGGGVGAGGGAGAGAGRDDGVLPGAQAARKRIVSAIPRWWTFMRNILGRVKWESVGTRGREVSSGAWDEGASFGPDFPFFQLAGTAIGSAHSCSRVGSSSRRYPPSTPDSLGGSILETAKIPKGKSGPKYRRQQAGLLARLVNEPLRP
jgi:hypothetical protein